MLRCLIGLAGLAMAACATGTIRVPYTPAPNASTAREPAGDPFPYQRGAAKVTNHVEAEGARHVVRLLAAPSAGENGQDGNLLTWRYFQSTAPGRKGLVIVVPISGGHAYPSTVVTRDLVGDGRIHVLQILRERMVMDWDAMAAASSPEVFAAIVRRTVARVQTMVIDLRRLMDWAEQRPEVDAGRIGLIGFSESTLQVAGVVASDARPAAAVLVMGGAHLHEVMMTCGGRPAEIRERIMRRFGWSREKLARTLEPLVGPIDPGRLGSQVDPRRILVIDAHHDDCIPASAREALWIALGRPERISVLSSHSGSFLGMTFLGGNHLRKAIGHFLERALG